ncbi:uncharacterized protein LOC111876892 [Lactuca sativa]|uniref:SWIM-type domain-containing protein n=1 Tax=Lactuca sativa TaxID=4236 RepID=A0A9R1UKY2_LACSA|nr:uncharacterized protein LOC111876892 [Lactuca sativa]KAJ0189350.1 hypothetical protein LSAT_V11C800391460 [Lactuca sativa]
MSFSYNDHEESFTNLHVYLHNIQRTNPHSYTYIKTNVLDRFQLCFVAIRCVINTFLGCMLPVIFIGSVRIRGEYLNAVFVAVAMDGNNNTTPIAFGIGVANNVNSCTWFLMRLKDAIGEGREVAFITNMDDTTSSCIGQVFLDAYHGYSSKSVLIYFRLRVGQSTNLDYFFFCVCKAYTTQYFQQSFSKLSYDAHEVLANIGNMKWAWAYFPNIRWNVLNINIPEFLLVLSVTQCNVPIVTLIDAIVQYIQQTWMLSTIFTSYTEMVLQRRMQKSLRWKATKIPPEIPSSLPSDIFQVFDLKRRCVVDLNRHTCPCGKWHSLGIACGHAIGAARYTNNMGLTDMVQIYYRTDVFRITYRTRNVNIVPPPSKWEIP